MHVDDDRVRQLQDAMRRDGVDAVVVRLPENVTLLTGYYQQIGGLGLVSVPAEGGATLLVPDYEEAEASQRWPGEVLPFPAIRLDGPPTGTAIADQLAALARRDGSTGGTVGFEGSFESIAPPTLAGEPNAVGLPTQALLRETFSTERLHDVTETLESMRAIKNERDLAALRRVNEIAMIGLDAFKELALPGISEVALAARVEAAVNERGAGYRDARIVRAYATVYAGPDLANGWQYFRSRTRVIQANEVVMLEMGTVADGYWCDHTRTVVAGRATERQREADAAARAAATAALRAAVPGVSGHDVDAAARAACAEAGFVQFPHHTGHGTGFRYHETRPQCVPGSTHPIERGQVIVSEPGIYADELAGGFRWEDDAVVGAHGAELLATSTYGVD